MPSSESLQQLAEFAVYLIAGLVALHRQDKQQRKAHAETEHKLHELKHHVDSQLTKLNGTASYMIHSWPGPAWIKRAVEENGQTVFRMQELNEVYAAQFGITRLSYIGKTDLEAGWDKETADRFREHDLKVWAKGGCETFVETIGGVDLKFMKLKLTSPDGSEKGVLGYGLPLDLFCPGPDRCPHFSKGEK